ncbi:unnamed protein product [Parnassius apollo]|uniref:(apollo) hypothetical protein n=1 Tax=Parnassius apollo TaxID=110799 RepID=A0A8S3WMC3_PARAO|nr:unnamed protein product [Parnassius apollo]
MDYKSELLLDTVALSDLSQFNPIPNNNNKILDLALSTSGNMTITNEKTLLKQDKHHPALRIDFQDSNSFNYKPLKVNESKRLNFYKCQYKTVKQRINNINWSDLLHGADVDEAVARFYDVIYEIINDCTPTVKNRSNKYPKWFSPGLRRCMREKNKYHYKKYKNPRDYDTFLSFELDVKNS